MALLIKLEKYEQELKWLALVLGIFSTMAIIQDWHPLTMFVSLQFCIVWTCCAWLHAERQLKYINILFTLLYDYGITRYYFFA
ncbi:MAG: peptidase [Gammaproteobacteria bacterium]|nr:peptidase [Gammaproteobacteria bacterium]